MTQHHDMEMVSASLTLRGEKPLVTSGSPHKAPVRWKLETLVTIFSEIWIKRLIKGLIIVGRELRQQHPSDLLSGARMSPPDNKSRGGRCRKSQPTVINPNYNMTKQLCIKCIYDKIRSISSPKRATLPICLYCDVTHLSLTTRVVALHIPLWRVGVREGCRQVRKTVAR